MAEHKSVIGTGLEDDKMNHHMKSTLDQYKKTSDCGEDVKEIDHKPVQSGTNPVGPMKGNLMGWTQMLESMDAINDTIDTMSGDISNEPVDTGEVSPMNDQDLLEELNKLFTPILVTQSIEGSISDQIQEAYSEADVLTEKNIIKFDDSTRMSQLLAVCSLLLARRKNSDKWKMYKKAAAIRNKMKLDIQKEENSDAKALAQKYLVKVSTTNPSSVARKAANELLPETQH